MVSVVSVVSDRGVVDAVAFPLTHITTIFVG